MKCIVVMTPKLNECFAPLLCNDVEYRNKGRMANVNEEIKMEITYFPSHLKWKQNSKTSGRSSQALQDG